MFRTLCSPGKYGDWAAPITMLYKRQFIHLVIYIGLYNDIVITFAKIGFALEQTIDNSQKWIKNMLFLQNIYSQNTEACKM